MREKSWYRLGNGNTNKRELEFLLAAVEIDGTLFPSGIMEYFLRMKYRWRLFG